MLEIVVGDSCWGHACLMWGSSTFGPSQRQGLLKQGPWWRHHRIRRGGARLTQVEARHCRNCCPVLNIRKEDLLSQRSSFRLFSWDVCLCYVCFKPDVFLISLYWITVVPPGLLQDILLNQRMWSRPCGQDGTRGGHASAEGTPQSPVFHGIVHLLNQRCKITRVCL